MKMKEGTDYMEISNNIKEIREELDFARMTLQKPSAAT